MTKAYLAQNTILSVLINYKDIVNKRITFFECAGGSTFVTDDEKLMEALEHHHDFNNGFVLKQVFDADEKTETPVQPETETEQPAQEAEGTTVTVASISEARDYLADNFGILKSALRSKTAIMTAAAEHNITFDGI